MEVKFLGLKKCKSNVDKKKIDIFSGVRGGSQMFGSKKGGSQMLEKKKIELFSGVRGGSQMLVEVKCWRKKRLIYFQA